MRSLGKIIFFGLLGLAFFLPLPSRADTIFNLTVTPAVIDIPSCEKGRICLEQAIAIKNNSAVRADVYAQVNDLSPTAGIISYTDPSQLPPDASLVRWIDFYRAVIEIPPGETATQTLRITASPNAQPGKYHAIISFPPGGNLTEAQLADQQINAAKVEINLDLVEHQVTEAEINLFQPAKALFTGNDIRFILKIKNIGNQPVATAGEIVIYDKGGREVGSLPIAGAEIAPGEIKDFPAAQQLRLGPGKFKAILNLNYGSDNGKNLTDVIYFSYLPLVWFLALIAIVLGLIYGAAWYLQKKRKGKKSAPTPAAGDQVPPAKAVHHHEKYVINLKK